MKAAVWCAGIAGLLFLAGTASAQEGGDTKAATFDSADAIAGWETNGDVSVDASKDRQGGEGGALKIGPGGKAVWKLRDADGSGKVELWVYDDQTKPAKPKEHRVGPRWGLVQKDGRALVVGILYAPYLGGDTTYAVSDSDQKSWFSVQYTAVKRGAGWHKWTFDFGAEKGLSIAYDGKTLPPNRFDWNKTHLAGFDGIAIFGDGGKENQQTIWVDDISVELGGSMQARPTPPPPPPPATPETDPAPEVPAPLVDALSGKHPRLLFGQEDVPALKAFIETPHGRKIWAQALKYLGSSKKPDKPTFLTDATDGQRQGFWRLPTVALHALLTGDKKSFDNTVEFMKFLMAQEHWETGGETDSGMSAANIMIGAALAYDWLYNDLDPDFRAKYRDKLLLQARRMYTRGHLGRGGGGGYWINDPQNNHRWHRNAGLTLCALAAAEPDKTDDEWILAKTKEELAFVARWLPDDGTSHESPTYMIFGAAHLMLGMSAGDRCFGTSNLQRPFFKNINRFMTQTLTPGLTGRFAYGDQGGTGVGDLGYDVFLLLTAGLHKESDQLAVLNTLLDRHGAAVTHAWLGTVWYPRDLKAGSLENIPDRDFFPDLGLQFVRGSWKPGDVGAMFKCGPFGGYLLNKYRVQEGWKYVNVAHDDPDANSFTLCVDGKFVATTDGYSKHKQSSNYNTILIEGVGQSARGRPQSGGWSQPATGNFPMHDIAVVTAKAEKGKNLAIEGEAAGSYTSRTRGAKRADLDRYRRIFLWVDGKYILVLDDIRAPKAVGVTWLMQGPALEAADASAQRYVLKAEEATCPFQVATTEVMAAKVADSSADSRGNPLGWKQLQLTANTAALRLASVYDPWKRGPLSVELKADGPDQATVTVTGQGITDTWSWTAGEGRFGPSKVSGTTASGETILLMDQPEPETRQLFEEIEAAAKQAAR